MNKLKKSGKVLNVPHLRFKDDKYTLLKLTDVAYKFDYGLNSEAVKYDGKHKYIRITDINEETNKYMSNNITTPSVFDNKYIVQKNDILLARTGTSTGKSYLYDCNDGTLYFAGFLIRINIDNNMNSKFIFYQFQTKRYKNWVKIISQRSGQPGINAEEYKTYKVMYCLKSTQDKIATFLTLIDKRIETQMKIIEEYKSLIKGIRERILSKNNLLEEITIKEAVNKKLIRVIKPNELSHFEGQKKYLSTSSINENGIEKIECYITYDNRPSRASMKPIKNSVWFAKMKNSIKIFHSIGNDEHEYILSTGFYGILCLSNTISSLWLEQIFKSDYFNNQKDKFSEGSSMSGVKNNQFSDLKIKIFKDNTYEQKYTETLNWLDQYIKKYSRILKLLYQEKEYLLSNLFI